MSNATTTPPGVDDATELLIRKVFSAFDDDRAEDFANTFTPDGRFRLGDAAPAVGRARIIEDIHAGNKLVKMHHDVHRVLPDGDRVYVDATVTYTPHAGGRQTQFPALIRAGMAGGLIDDMLVVMDRSPSHPFHDMPEVLDPMPNEPRAL